MRKNKYIALLSKASLSTASTPCDEKEQIYSITLDKVDVNKKYKIALPIAKDIDFNSKEKIKINL